jgi:hypothetical protein
VKACASDKSFHRKATLQDHLRLAREQVEQMGDPESEELSQRVAKARQRAMREKQQRLGEALKALEQIEASRSKTSEKKKVRASSTDPEARIMLQAKGAYGPAYNVQISTDAQSKIIVGVGVTQARTGCAQLEPAVSESKPTPARSPQMVVDAGLTNQATEAMTEKQVDLIGALPERRAVAPDRLKQRGVSPDFYPQAFEYDAKADSCRCPAGKVLHYETEERSGASVRRRYRARGSDCRGCAFQAQCCPGTKKGRSVVRSEATPEMAAFQAQMETPEAQAICARLGWRNFRMHGLKIKLGCVNFVCVVWSRPLWKPCGPA